MNTTGNIRIMQHSSNFSEAYRKCMSEVNLLIYRLFIDDHCGAYKDTASSVLPIELDNFKLKTTMFVKLFSRPKLFTLSKVFLSGAI